MHDHPLDQELVFGEQTGFRALKEASKFLAVGGAVLLVCTLNQIIFSAFPLALIKPEWQLGLSGSIIGNGIIALLGTLLICTAQLFNQNDPAFDRRALLLRRLSYWVAIAFFLLIPFMPYAGVKLMNQRAAVEAANQKEWKQLSGRIRGATNEAELRAVVGSLPQPPPLPPKFEVPVEVVKQRMAEVVDARAKALDNQAEEARANRWQTFLLEAARNTLQAFLLGIGFAAIGKSSPMGPSLLEKMQVMFLRTKLRPRY